MATSNVRKLIVQVLGDSSGVQKAADVADKSLNVIGNAADKAKSSLAPMFSQLADTGVFGAFGDVVDQVSSKLSGLEVSGKTATKVLAGAGVGMAAAGLALTHAAAGDVQALNQLKQSVENTGSSFDDFSDQFEKAGKQNLKFAFATEDTNDALRKLTEATGDPQKALDNMSVVANLAADKHIKLADAADIVAKILNGKGAKALASYGIQVKENADKTKDYQGALDELAAKIDGQAAASVQGFSGHLRVLKAQIEDQVQALGAKYGPALTGIGAGITLVSGLTSAASGVFKSFRTATEAQAVATEALTVAETESAVAEGAMLLPALAIIAAIALLAAGVIYAYTHWDWFREAVDKVGDGLQWFWSNVIAPFADWLSGNFVTVLETVARVMLATFTVGLSELAILIHNHWDDIVGFIEKLPGRIGTAASGMWDGIKDGFRAAINWIIDGWNRFTNHIGIPEIDTHIPGIGKVGGWSLGDAAHIDRLHTGGVFSAPTPGGQGLALLRDGERVSTPGMGGGGITIIVQGSMLSTERELVSIINKARRQGVNV